MNPQVVFLPHSSRAGEFPPETVHQAEHSWKGGKHQAMGLAFQGGRSYQQDAYSVHTIPCGKEKEWGTLAVLCDGHGRDAEEISEELVATIFPQLVERWAKKSTPEKAQHMTSQDWELVMEGIFRRAQWKLLQFMVQRSPLHLPLSRFIRCFKTHKVGEQPVPIRRDQVWESGSTVVLMLSFEGAVRGETTVVVANSGDGECRLGTGPSSPFDSLGEIHSVLDEAEMTRMEQWKKRLRKQGCREHIKLDLERGRVSYHLSGFERGKRYSVEPTRSLGHPILSAMGLSFLPSVSVTRASGPLTLMLLSDGGTDVLSHQEFDLPNVDTALVRRREFASWWREELLKQQKRHPNMDNTTLVLLFLDH